VTTAIDLAPVREGDILLGRYRIEKALGVGGMAVVVSALHLQLNQLVAIKFLLPHVLLNEEVVKRFTREARAAVRIRNEHVARVMDVGELESGIPYIVMEHLDGRDLAEVIRQRTRLPPLEAVDYLLQGCEAIAEAHRLGIVHRDLKPANLFVVDSQGGGSIKVLDFGISKTLEAGGSAGGSMTQSALMLGSPAYMSPEQITSAKDVDSRTDIWSLGIVLYEMLSGEQPFKGDSIPSICMNIMNAKPTPLVVREVTPGLDAVVFRCLEKDRERRFADVSELAAALEPFAPARSRLSLERIAAMGTAPAPRSSLPSSSGSSDGSTIALERLPGPHVSAFDTGKGKVEGGAQSRLSGSVAREWANTQGEGSRRKPRWKLSASLGAAALALGVVFWVFSRGTNTKVPEPSVVSSPVASSPITPTITPVAAAVAPPDAPTPRNADAPDAASGAAERRTLAPQIAARPPSRPPVPRRASPAPARVPPPHASQPASAGWEDDR